MRRAAHGRGRERRGGTRRTPAYAHTAHRTHAPPSKQGAHTRRSNGRCLCGCATAGARAGPVQRDRFESALAHAETTRTPHTQAEPRHSNQEQVLCVCVSAGWLGLCSNCAPEHPHLPTPRDPRRSLRRLRSTMTRTTPASATTRRSASNTCLSARTRPRGAKRQGRTDERRMTASPPNP